ncbi:Schizosaccharomyces specific protein [Schizosaccharomyces osmophilus]|uniref:Schizosaccharomyces specific protein n=1 Tax=Schizosaccharomyces osmophilus TaxID=2545709 RepID=A0AAE9WBC5_9SCHI|nr:Schizosaccharomyces specific protein [Schizosaccharomyces osmophilus]WBW73109.1 Schizosaccharomyces specific protein [Schizosaccharomyces osmophilus]
MGSKRSYSSLNYDVSRKRVLDLLEVPLKKLTIEDPSSDLDVDMVHRNRIAYYKNKYTVVVEDLDAEIEEEEDDKKKNSSLSTPEQSRLKLSVISPLEKKLKRDLYCLLYQRPSMKTELPRSDYSISSKYASSADLPEAEKLFEEGRSSFNTTRGNASCKSLRFSCDLDLG